MSLDKNEKHHSKHVVERVGGTITNDSVASPLLGSFDAYTLTETIDIDGYEKFSVHMQTTDSTNELSMLGSMDGSNWDHIETMYSLSHGSDYQRIFTSHNGTHTFLYRYYRLYNRTANNIPFSSFRYVMLR